MARVDADPEALRRLRDQIQGGRMQIDQAVAQMRGALQNAAWNDDKRRQFETEFETLLRSVSAFGAQADELRSYLARKAAALDTYSGR